MDEKINIIVNSFFEKLSVSVESIDIIEEDKGIFLIKMKTDDSGMLIGPHGKNLESIQMLLRMMISKNVGNKVRLHLEINDYIENKDEKLFSFIKSKIISVEKNQRDIELPFYSSYDRKKIHSYVADYGNGSIFTKSIGEGKERRLYICKEGAKLTIDIDGDDI